MEEILNSLQYGEILYITRNGNQYLFIRRNLNFDVIYSIGNRQKSLPLHTINSALEAFNNGEQINAHWYINFNQHEYTTRPCNLSVLKELLNRVQNISRQ